MRQWRTDDWLNEQQRMQHERTLLMSLECREREEKEQEVESSLTSTTSTDHRSSRIPLDQTANWTLSYNSSQDLTSCISKRNGQRRREENKVDENQARLEREKEHQGRTDWRQSIWKGESRFEI